METFQIEILETKTKVIEILAESIGNALQIADKMYRNGEIVLDDMDNLDYKISVL